MQTITISDAAYKTLLSRRIGSESLSTVITREMKPMPPALAELKAIEKGKFYKLSEI